jgi:hypothetical protein
VGAFGTGGGSSGGKAQGFRTESPGVLFPNRQLSNTGNFDAGRFNVTEGGRSIGSTNGAFRQHSVRGHSTGIFGNWSGQCDEVDFPDDCEDLP